MDKPSKPLERAIEKHAELARWKANPYKCLYHNPRKYTLMGFARWAQRYMQYKIYLSLLKAAKITGYEPVPAELLNRNAKRQGLSGRKIRVGKLWFYLVQEHEMTKHLLKNYTKFKKIALKEIDEAR